MILHNDAARGFIKVGGFRPELSGKSAGNHEEGYYKIEKRRRG